jgi:hypothetical protein
MYGKSSSNQEGVMKMASQNGTNLIETEGSNRNSCCGGAVKSPSVREERPAPLPEPNLEDLLPIAVVIAAGCESCAEKAVTRALEHGSPRAHIQKALQIIAKFQKLDCFAQAVGADVVARMERPLAAGNRTLREALNHTDH